MARQGLGANGASGVDDATGAALENVRWGQYILVFPMPTGPTRVASRHRDWDRHRNLVPGLRKRQGAPGIARGSPQWRLSQGLALIQGMHEGTRHSVEKKCPVMNSQYSCTKLARSGERAPLGSARITVYSLCRPRTAPAESPPYGICRIHGDETYGRKETANVASELQSQ
jgi:hypothetical protein